MWSVEPYKYRWPWVTSVFKIFLLYYLCFLFWPWNFSSDIERPFWITLSDLETHLKVTMTIWISNSGLFYLCRICYSVITTEPKTLEWSLKVTPGHQQWCQSIVYIHTISYHWSIVNNRFSIVHRFRDIIRGGSKGGQGAAPQWNLWPPCGPPKKTFKIRPHQASEQKAGAALVVILNVF